MNNLFEMMMQAQGGNAMQNMARQFGLAPEQAQSAVEALLPAFQVGMERQASSVDGLQQMMQMFGGGQFAGFHDADGDGIPDEAATQGNDVLGQLFGSKDVSRAIAAQASAMSGVSDSVMKQMLPVIASMLMGGMFKGAMNNGLGGLIGQAMQGGMAGNAASGGFGNILGQMMGGQQQPQNPMGNMMGGNMMGGLLGNLLGGLMGGAKPAPPPPQDPMMAGFDMLKGMFQTGQQVQQTQMDSLQQIFEQFSGRR
jgi:hypothetical protein